MIGQKKSPINDECVRFMTPREWGKLQGFIDYAFKDDNGIDHFSFPKKISVLQQYKQFENGGPFHELLSLTPAQAKHFPQRDTSGLLREFVNPFDGRRWQLEPKTAYYDWIYSISAMAYLNAHPEVQHELLSYTIFTDIAFNPMKSINCQARTLAKLTSLLQNHEAEKYLSNPDTFLSLYQSAPETVCEQMRMNI